MERPFFFQTGAQQLFGVLHSPDPGTPKRGLLMCHAFGEEKLWSHRVFVNFAREAASEGIPVLRFDFRGHGDSDGHSEDCTIASYLSDIETARKTLQDLHPTLENIDILGLRFGATLAANYADTTANVGNLILWEPIVDCGRYMQELLRINLSTQLAVYGSVREDREALVEKMQGGENVNVDGYLISKTFYNDCNAVSLEDLTNNKSDSRTLVVQIAPVVSQKDRVDLRDLAARFGEADFLKVQEPPFWREIKPFTSKAVNLIGQSLAWLRDTNGE